MSNEDTKTKTEDKASTPRKSFSLCLLRKQPRHPS